MKAFSSEPKLPSTSVAEQLNVSIQAVHKQLKELGMQLKKIGNKSYITHENAQQIFNLSFKKHTFAFQIVKGGTGKTTCLHNIACIASVYGAKVLVIDIDPQGNLTDAFHVDPEDKPVLIDLANGEATVEDAIVPIYSGIDLIPSRIENATLDSTLAIRKAPLHNFFSNILEDIEDNYDFIFIDCPPHMGHSVTAATLYVDTVVIPMNPDRFSANGLKLLKDEITSLEKQYKETINYKVFLNKFAGNTILSDKAIETTISNENHLGNALTTAVRQSQEIPNATDNRLNVFSTLKKSTARDDFDLLAKELLEINIKPRI